MKGFSKSPKEVFFSKNDKTDPRLGEIVKQECSDSNLYCILGYPDDEGIKNNGGRVGASEGPNKIRHFLYRMTPPLNRELPAKIIDLGNLEIGSQSLSERHEFVRSVILSELEKQNKCLTFGGGHDYAFADGAAFANFCKSQQQKPLVINFDAHLDVRPISEKINSGTPFFRLLEMFPEVELVQVGIQSQCNSQNHLDWITNRGAHILFNDELLLSSNPAITILKFLEPWLVKRRLCFLSLDIDVFSTETAPGCSQSWPFGVEPKEIYKVFEVLFSRLDIKVFGIYEVSPPLDANDRTSKLAAQFAYQYLTN